MKVELPEPNPSNNDISGISIENIWIGSIETYVIYQDSPSFSLRVCINNMMMTTVVDTGSQYSLIDIDTWKSLQV